MDLMDLLKVGGGVAGGSLVTVWATLGAFKADLTWIKATLRRLETRLNGTVEEVADLDKRTAILESRREETRPS